MVRATKPAGIEPGMATARRRLWKRWRTVGIALAVGATFAARPAVARCRDWAPLKNAYFGDLHSHTSYSLDAYLFGTRTDPTSAFAFARGAAVAIGEGYDPSAGQEPGPSHYTIAGSGGALDFATVTDHAEFLGTDWACTRDPASPLYGSPYCTALRARMAGSLAVPCADMAGAAIADCVAAQTSAWADERRAAELANEPCAFTTFPAYEWTATDGGNPFPATLHKNVYFRDARVPDAPLDAIAYPQGPQLWSALAAACNGTTGCQALTIPHNANKSQGLAFDVGGFGAADLNRMRRYQRAVEIHQHKGNSECLSDTADGGATSACDFEVVPANRQPTDVPGYVRPALESGLVQRASLGIDPVTVGFVGGTDSHDGTPGAVGESAFVGHAGAQDDTAEARVRGDTNQPVARNPGGLTGVWAEENTRAAIWAALQRRETFATSGPRIRVRLYAYVGGPDPCTDPAFPASVVARGGVPMGGTVARAPGTPSFVVAALADTTPLAAVDFVKASIVDGVVQERVSTVPAGGSSVCVTWTDAAFDAAAPAFYYARVREQPSWRWSHFDCLTVRQAHPIAWQTIAPRCASNDPAAGGLDVTVQERAWTSPIWYLPGGPVTIPTTQLRLRDGSAQHDPTRRRFVFRSQTRGERSGHRVVPPTAGSGGDPTLAGAVLDVYNGESGEQAHVTLPAGRWKRASGGRWYAYVDPVGPVQLAIVAADRLAVYARGAGWPYTLDEARQGAVAVRLRLGDAAPWCAEAPARTASSTQTTGRNDVVDVFEAQAKAPAPEQCPLPSVVP